MLLIPSEKTEFSNFVQSLHLVMKVLLCESPVCRRRLIQSCIGAAVSPFRPLFPLLNTALGGGGEVDGVLAAALIPPLLNISPPADASYANPVFSRVTFKRNTRPFATATGSEWKKKKRNETVGNPSAWEKKKKKSNIATLIRGEWKFKLVFMS